MTWFSKLVTWWSFKTHYACRTRKVESTKRERKWMNVTHSSSSRHPTSMNEVIHGLVKRSTALVPCTFEPLGPNLQWQILPPGMRHRRAPKAPRLRFAVAPLPASSAAAAATTTTANAAQYHCSVRSSRGGEVSTQFRHRPDAAPTRRSPECFRYLQSQQLS